MSESVDTQLIRAFVSAKNVAGTENVGGWLYTPAESDDELPRILGRPAIVVEGMPTIGSQGDTAFCDLSQYLFVDKGGMEFVNSPHVSFSRTSSARSTMWTRSRCGMHHSRHTTEAQH
jgi:hypothetical protein